MRFLLLAIILAGGLYGMSWWDRREKNFDQAAREGRVIIGMRKTQMVQAIGEPTTITTRSEVFNETERCTYENGPIVTLKNGRVAGVEVRERRASPEPTASWMERTPGGKGASKPNRSINSTERDVREQWGWPKHGSSLNRDGNK